MKQEGDDNNQKKYFFADYMHIYTYSNANGPGKRFACNALGA